MAAYLFDLDGTTVRYHAREWLPGIVARLADLHASGHQIIFVTMRGDQDAGTPWSLEETNALLAQLPFPHRLVSGVQSPRVLVDDAPSGVRLAITDCPESWMHSL